MAVANPRWKPSVTKVRSFLRWLIASLKSQWLASALLLPLAFFALQTHTARQDAKDARIQAVSVDRLSKIQDSGKALDLALASYFQSIADLGLAEQHVRSPGSFTVTPVPHAQEAVVEARDGARKALAKHAGDIQGLRGTLDSTASANYMAALAVINTTIEGDANIDQTGRNITSLSKLVVARNALIDRSMKAVG